jgi:hypothetical protein
VGATEQRVLKRIDDLDEAQCDQAIKSLEMLRTIVKRRSGIRHDQGLWGIHSGDHKPDELNYCGTSACAAGKLALSPEGKAAGIKHHWYRDSRKGPWALAIGTERVRELSMTGIAEHISGKIGVPTSTLVDIFRVSNGTLTEQKRDVLERIAIAIYKVRRWKTMIQNRPEEEIAGLRGLIW